jgi:spore germination protein YaaH
VTEHSTSPRRPTGRQPARAWLVALLVLLSAAQTAAPAAAREPFATKVADTDAPVRRHAPPALDAGDDPLADGAALPSVHYRHAASHAADVIAFEPGERVSVPFRPRADDAWAIDGKPPNALPAGGATGEQMRDARPDSTAFLDQPAAPAVMGELAATTGDAEGADVDSTAVVGPGGLRREVFGFLPYWELTDSSTVLDWRTLSTVAYFSVGCTSSGGLWKRNADGSVSTGWAGWTSSRMTSIINRAHEHGTRVVLTVSCFAWSSSGASTQASVLGSAGARTTLARQVAAAVRDRGADGVNLDFEPIVSGYSEEFAALVRAVRRELNAIAPGYQLTFDAMGSIGNQPIAEATGPGAADAVVIMGYDYRTAGASVAGSISPLSGPVYDLNDTIRAFTARVPASRLILGVPYYGRAWSTATSELHSTTLNPAKYGAVAEPSYAQAADVAATYGRRYDRIEAAPWAAYRRQTCTAAHGCVTSWRQMYYDDGASLRLRYDLVNRAGLRGAGIWALGYDGSRPELRAALADKFLADHTPPRVGIETLPERVRDEGFRVRWPASDASAIRDYDVQVSVDGGSFAPWLRNTTLTNSMILARHGRTYAFRVRATDVHRNTSAWKSTPLGYRTVPGSLKVGGFGRVIIDGLKMRSSPSTGGTIMTTLGARTALQLTGGPVQRDGYTWFQVSGPMRQWGAVAPIQAGGWVAAYGNGATHLVPRRPIYATRVNAGMTGLRLADGGARVLTPNGDGRQDTLPLSWTNRRSFAGITLRVHRLNGALVGTVTLPADKTDRGATRWEWNGRIGGERVSAGAYVVQLQGRRNGTLYNAPSANPLSVAQIARFGVVVGAAPPTTVLAFDSPINPNRASSLTWRLRFGGPIGALSAGDFSRSGTATGCRIGTPTGSGASWSVTLFGCSAGTVALALKPRTVVDAVRNWGPAGTVSSRTLLIDRSPPIASAPRISLRRGEPLVSSSPAAALLAVVSWFGADPGGAGIRSFDLRRSTDGGAWTTVATGITGTTREVALVPGHTHRFEVRARDRAGNVGAWVASPTFVAQLRQEGWDAVRWRGDWNGASTSAFSAGSVRYSTDAGASFRTEFTGRGIAWVSTLGSSHGAARVYLDGALVATVGTSSKATLHRRIVFARTWSTVGTHTLRIVVVGTAGHARVDLDALEIVR